MVVGKVDCEGGVEAEMMVVLSEAGKEARRKRRTAMEGAKLEKNEKFLEWEVGTF